jgi:hypothetical protein
MNDSPGVADAVITSAETKRYDRAKLKKTAIVQGCGEGT